MQDNSNQPALLPFQQRVVDEVSELDTRRAALAAFVEGEIFQTLPEPERADMETQLNLMAGLSHVLHRRIGRFNKVGAEQEATFEQGDAEAMMAQIVAAVSGAPTLAAMTGVLSMFIAIVDAQEFDMDEQAAAIGVFNEAASAFGKHVANWRAKRPVQEPKRILIGAPVSSMAQQIMGGRLS